MLTSGKGSISGHKLWHSLSARENFAKRLQLDLGYTVLVVDANILLPSLFEVIGQLLESLEWTVVVPLPIITASPISAHTASPSKFRPPRATIWLISTLRAQYGRSHLARGSIGRPIGPLAVQRPQARHHKHVESGITYF